MPPVLRNGYRIPDTWVVIKSKVIEKQLQIKEYYYMVCQYYL